MDSTSGSGAPENGAVTLTREQISIRLREVALFQGLGQDDLTEILRISEQERVDAGEYVFEEGARGDHFYVIVHGEIELRKATGDGVRKLAVLGPGQAFGEMALLNQTPRSASALALTDTYLLSVSRAAFSLMLGGDTLAVRLLKNLSKALWATSVRLASQQRLAYQQKTASPEPDSGHETLSEFNRLLRARLLPRVTPRVSGYDIAASTLALQDGSGCTAWDWFVLTDGRPAFTVTRAGRSDEFAAQRLASVRMLLRAAASEPQTDLGALMTRVNRACRTGWVEGLSGPVLVGIAALADGVAEWVEAGAITGVVARGRGMVEDLSLRQPALGAEVDTQYDSTMIVLGTRDRIVALTDAYGSAALSIGTVVVGGEGLGSREALTRVLASGETTPGSCSEQSDVSALVITRTIPGAPGIS